MIKNNKGFTLVELIVIIVIISILAVVGGLILVQWVDKARDAQLVDSDGNSFVVSGYNSEIVKKQDEISLSGDSLDKVGRKVKTYRIKTYEIHLDIGGNGEGGGGEGGGSKHNIIWSGLRFSGLKRKTGYGRRKAT
ncbi:prepilin-type N-terminal cleavage/methylation domain-containing protein [Candidatus Vampirococcus lugosii]|uniref:Pilin-related protein n=1 Tax=Candidatus Vampirococcus lugosii TaxID=2789015 RepID=A0ABS5QMZ3_9BACT|nr:prepilin-type N-terminal cleavage/methylation domain-containing protein [Candidatus Vampirococcus lugosii]MBS8122442.1 Pilin-related protein [Candidatus Vampirococcus lugosii]